MGLRPQNAPGAPPAPSSYLSRRWRPGPGSHRDLQRGSATFRDMNNMIKQEDRHAQRAAGPPPSPWRRPCRAHNAWGSAMRTCRAYPGRLPPLIRAWQRRWGVEPGAAKSTLSRNREKVSRNMSWAKVQHRFDVTEEGGCFFVVHLIKGRVRPLRGPRLTP